VWSHNVTEDMAAPGGSEGQSGWGTEGDKSVEWCPTAAVLSNLAVLTDSTLAAPAPAAAASAAAAATVSPGSNLNVIVAVGTTVPPQVIVQTADGVVLAKETIPGGVWDIAPIFTPANSVISAISTLAAANGAAAAAGDASDAAAAAAADHLAAVTSALAASATATEHHILLACSDGYVVGATINTASASSGGSSKASAGSSSNTKTSILRLTKTWPRRQATSGSTTSSSTSAASSSSAATTPTSESGAATAGAVSPPAPGPDSYGVICVKTNPRKPGHFISLERRVLHCWSLSNTSQPTVSERETHYFHSTMDWSPHDPNLVAIGYTDGRLTILDVRYLTSDLNQKQKWTVAEAHRGVVRDIKWNPFTPYWIATAGDDGAIRIWDIRGTAQPVKELLGHVGPVLTVSSLSQNLFAPPGADFAPFFESFLGQTPTVTCLPQDQSTGQRGTGLFGHTGRTR